ncbi:MAG: DUF512 domain-containing protein, partial [Oscillospiraceae bacterium]|nr:DUF512 domain-containing protein [Oscillospiraceae bacterium]
IQVYSVVNKTFGETVTVSGLLTGRDLVESLSGKNLGHQLLLPSNMLEHSGTRFLDDMTIEQLSQLLGVKVAIIETDGCALVQKLVSAFT